MLITNCTRSQAEPASLLTPRRLDIAIKWKFFGALRDDPDWRASDARRLYRWHIVERTGGVEPRSWKVRLEDYENAAGDLLGEMVACGFKHRSPIEVGSCGGLIDGAHRLACALMLGVRHVAIATSDAPARAAAWDLYWLKRHGMNNADMLTVYDDFATLWRGKTCAR